MQYSIDTTSVSHERLHDEVIVINLASGAYYSGTGTAADLWTLIASGLSADYAAAVLTKAYEADGETVARDIAACLQSLVDRNVLLATDAGHSGSTPQLPEMLRNVWKAPVFDEYTDMWDLLQADPIHDVGEAGWPYAIPQKS